LGHISDRPVAALVIEGSLLLHHALQCREPDWSTIFDWDPAQAARWLAEVSH
jgi:hypothetical protein